MYISLAEKLNHREMYVQTFKSTFPGATANPKYLQYTAYEFFSLGARPCKYPVINTDELDGARNLLLFVESL
jgi:hypothetical protein